MPDQLPAGKKEQVRRMFDGIAPRYDFLNHFLSLGIDKSWRRRAMAQLAPLRPKTILDMATGTGDLAIEAIKLDPEKIVGIDISEAMLAIGRQKVSRLDQGGIIELICGDSENTGMESHSFDAVTAAFGVRNFENLATGLSEMFRVLRPDGMAVVLEFTEPRKFPVKQLYGFYFHYILPFFGRIISRDRDAYAYLPRSVSAFPHGTAFIEKMHEAGFADTKLIPLTFGIAAIYTGRKTK